MFLIHKRTQGFPLISLLFHAVLLFIIMLIAVHVMRQNHYDESSKDFSKNIISFEKVFFQNEMVGVVKVLGSIDDHIGHLFNSDKDMKANLAFVQKHFDDLKEVLKADIIYAMDLNGEVIVSTKYDGNLSLLGNNYVFRPYFMDAKEGKNVIYPAVGVTTKKRGIYFSSPILNHDGVVSGVIVIKVGLDLIDELFGNTFNGPTYFINPDGNIFSSSDKGSFFKNLYKDLGYKNFDKNSQSLDVDNVKLNVFRKEYVIPGNEKWEIVTILPSLSKTFTGFLITFALFLIGSYVFFINFIDIYKKKKIEEIRRMEGEESLLSILGHLPLPLYIADSNKKIIFINSNCLNLVNYKNVENEQIVGKNEQLIKFENEEELFKLEYAHVEDKVLLEGGQVIPVLRTSMPLLFQGKKRKLILLVDLRDQKEKEQRLKEHNNFVHQVFESIESSLFVYNTTDDVVEISNSKAISLGVLERRKLRGEDLKLISQNFERQILLDFCDEILKINDLLIKEVSGDSGRIYEFQGNPLSYDEFSSKKKIVVIIRDITNKKNLEKEREDVRAQLFQTTKLASIGELAAGVAHEINNPLTIIKGHLDWAEEVIHKLPGGNSNEEITKLFFRMKDGVKRISKIVSGLRTYARTDQKVSLAFDIHESLNSAVEMVKTVFQKMGVDITTDFANEKFFVLGKEGQFQQVIMNFLTNAKDAILEKKSAGSILIKTTRDGGTCRIDFIDDGIGMDDTVKSRIFETFFTTKPAGKGTGLGMGISSSIIKEMNGKIDVESILGKGTTISVAIPLKDEAGVTSTKIDKLERGIPKKNEASSMEKLDIKVVIVDDEEDIGFLLKRILLRFVSDVEYFSNGLEALEKLKKSKYDLLLTDINMPIISGEELIKRTLAESPHKDTIKILAITGGVDVENQKNISGELKSKLAGIIEKPFEIANVQKTITNLFS